MKYALLIHWREPSPEEMEGTGQILEDCYRHNIDLAEQGVFLEGAPLMLTPTAKTVRVRDGRTIISDGPFAETKEQLGGYSVLECDAERVEEVVEEILRVQRNEDGGVELHEIGGRE